MKKTHLLAATSFAALSLVLPSMSALAQNQGAAGSDVEEVIVSASRINISGYEQPTPVTVVDTEAMQRDAQTNLGGLFRSLPAFGVASSPDTNQGAQAVSNGGGGAEQVNLRNLGSARTLVLVNGVRVVGTELTGSAVDVSMVPSMLLQRVDVVTGGASAAWGSDAIAGVVNFVTNDRFDGLQVSIDGANNHWLNKVSGKVQLAYGTDFADGRGHTILGLSYLNSPLTPLASEASWRDPNDYIALVTNPLYGTGAGQSTTVTQFLTAHNVKYATKTHGGLIASGPLKGTQFVGPNGTPAPFNFGNVSGLFCTNCDGQDPIRAGQNDPLSVPIQNMSVYSRTTFDLTDDIKASFDFNGARVSLHNSSITTQRDITIKADNAFLDPGIAARMQTLGLASFILGTTNQNNLPIGANPNTKARNQIGNFQARSTRNLIRFVGGLEGNLAGSWTWNLAGHYSTSWRHAEQYNGVHLPSYNLAIDAVRVTAANAGASGLPIGTIVCRSSLTNPTNGCKPLNVFGEGVASQDAIDYVNPAPGKPRAQYNDLRLHQYTASASVSGELIDLPAGPVAAAAGLDFRRDHTIQTANAEAYLVQYAAGNFQPFNAAAVTKEVFGEVAAPILKDSFVRSLDVNGAFRVTNYTNSGTVVTWKGGAVTQLTDDIRLRGTVSRDIRAPAVFDLFNPGSYAASSAAIPNQPFAADAQSGGNPNLKPEKATTWMLGTVLTPQFIPGLTISADWFNISIKDVFFTANSRQIYDQCQLGNQAFCNVLVRNSLGQVTLVRTVPVNASKNTVAGMDFQADYKFDALNGQMALSVTASYMHKDILVSPVATYSQAGSLNLDLGGSGQPKLRSTMKLTYNYDVFSGTIQSRFIGTGKVNNQFHEGTGPNSIDNNHVPWTAYLDLRASYNFGPDGQFQVYAAIDNLLDVSPALIPSTSLQQFAGFYPPTSMNFYDGLGRSYRYGLRMRF